MKKSKLSIGLVTSFIAALAMTACSGTRVTKKDGQLVELKGNDGETIVIDVNAIYDEYRLTSDGISKYYKAILETLIRHDYKTTDLPIVKNYAQIESEAKNQVNGAKNTAKENSKTNGTSYEKEWKAILSNNGVEDEEELLQKYIYDAEKNELEDAYFEAKKASLLEEYIGVKADGSIASSKVDSVYPYHIKHILLSVEGGNTNYFNGTITESEAKNMIDVLSKLVDTNYTFGEIAKQYSGDSGSKNKYGDAGIMSTTTSFINEFKLGTYAYDLLLSGRTDVSADIKKGLGLSGTVINSGSSDYSIEEKLNNLGNDDTNLANEANLLAKVPYGVFKLLAKDDLYTKTKDNNNKNVNEGNEAYYPRNILWNRYLNLHNPFVITNEDITAANVNGTDNIGGQAVSSTRFNEQGYLTDGEGNVIIGVRGSYGIHLIVMQRSPLDTTKDGSSLEDYFTMKVPGDEGFPEGPSYVGYISTSIKSDYETRSNEIKDAVKAFDSTYDYRLYEYLIKDREISFNDRGGQAANLGEMINRYIDSQRATNKESRAKDLNSKWREYIELLEVQYSNRTLQTTTNKDGRLIPTVCAISFGDNANGLYNEGGLCSYAK